MFKGSRTTRFVVQLLVIISLLLLNQTNLALSSRAASGRLVPSIQNRGYPKISIAKQDEPTTFEQFKAHRGFNESAASTQQWQTNEMPATAVIEQALQIEMSGESEKLVSPSPLLVLKHSDWVYQATTSKFKATNIVKEPTTDIIHGTHYTAQPAWHGKSNNSIAKVLIKRHAAQEINPDCEVPVSRKPAIYGLRCDDAEVTDDGGIIIRAFKPTRVYIIGRNLYSNLTVAITVQDGAPQDDCTHADRIKSLKIYNLSLNIAEIEVELPPPVKPVPYYFCVREDTVDSRWFHQGSEPWLKIYIEKDFMPIWMKIITIAILLSASGLFSGLNLGLMSLDKNELQVIMKCGSEEEKRYATAIEPVRRRGNYLLCSILFSNTLVNSTISVFLEDLSDGLIAIITSTILIVLFGEILPQAFCSRHGLAVGARTIWMTNFCMFITFPLSYPVSTALDWALGEEIGHAYDRERLMEFIQVTKDINNLEADEVNIISGALKIKRVQIGEVMTRIEDVYMLDENAVLDFDTIQAIVGKGYSRIPVHEQGNRRNIKAVLFAKDLALVDPDDKTPVQTMINFYNHPRMFVFEDTTLDKALNEFKTGKSHMAIVQRIIDDGDKDPYYEVTGIVTLEDVIEEIMQMEINDETDTLTDNRRKRRRKDAQVRKDFSQFTNLGSGDSSFNVVTPQLCLAAYQYLATTVEPFTANYLSDSILRRLLSQKIFYKVKLEDDSTLKRLYTAGEPADYFIMILEGRVHVVCGKENLIFNGGPFSFFGKAALTQVDAPVEQAAPVVSSAGATIVTPTISARKDSIRPALSRRESLAKIVTSQLSLATKKSPACQEQTEAQTSAQVNTSPTNSTGQHAVASLPTGAETVELVERGSYYFKPDYTVDIIANTSYLKVTRNDYLTALRATLVEREGAALLAESGTSTDGLMPPLDGSPTFSIEFQPRRDDS